jgi:hypothetical protein
LTWGDAFSWTLIDLFDSVLAGDLLFKAGCRRGWTAFFDFFLVAGRTIFSDFPPEIFFRANTLVINTLKSLELNNLPLGKM